MEDQKFPSESEKFQRKGASVNKELLIQR